MNLFQNNNFNCLQAQRLEHQSRRVKHQSRRVKHQSPRQSPRVKHQSPRVKHQSRRVKNEMSCASSFKRGELMQDEKKMISLTAVMEILLLVVEAASEEV